MVDPAHTSAFTTALPGQFSRVNSVVCPRGTQEQMCSQELQEGTVNKRASCVVTKGTDGDGSGAGKVKSSGHWFRYLTSQEHALGWGTSAAWL